MDFSTKLITQSLTPLVKEASVHPASLSFNPQIALECPTGSGGKFWKGAATAHGIDLSWGRLGTHGNSKSISVAQCVQNNPVLELRDRALGKLAKGYDIIPHETKLP